MYRMNRKVSWHVTKATFNRNSYIRTGDRVAKLVNVVHKIINKLISYQCNREELL